MSIREEKRPPRQLSPTSRRAFMLALPASVVAGATMSGLGSCGGGIYIDYANYGDYGDYIDLCYCNGPGRDYNEICGIYCNYINYGD